MSEERDSNVYYPTVEEVLGLIFLEDGGLMNISFEGEDGGNFIHFTAIPAFSNESFLKGQLGDFYELRKERVKKVYISSEELCSRHYPTIVIRLWKTL